jgi:2',3'-cyclic-nucleotide 2'-phosphodiesterase (5'-nucleotidase family)
VTTLELLHWNDVHGRFDGLARLSARARRIRATAHHPVLLLDGGDVEEQSVRLSALTFGVAGWRLLGAAGVDAAVVGNGGLLRYGPARLREYAAALGSPPLVCDLETRDGSTPDGAAPSVLLGAGDLRVGVIGATDYYPQQYDEFGLRERGRVTAVREEADRLRARGADVVVLLSHAGVHQDRGMSWAWRHKVDLIIGGHTHDLLTGGDEDHGIPIAQAGSYAEHLGRVVLQVDETGARVVGMTVEAVPVTAPADPQVLEELAAAERDLEKWLDEPIGHLDSAAAHDPMGRCGVSMLLAQALLDAEPADIAMVVAASCTSGLPAGTVTRRDIWEATSSPGNLATATLTGAQIRAMLAVGASEEFATAKPRTFRGRERGRLQVVGVDWDGDTALVNGEPLDIERGYRVTASDLELSTYGGLLTTDPADRTVDPRRILPEILEDYLRGL